MEALLNRTVSLEASRRIASLEKVAGNFKAAVQRRKAVSNFFTSKVNGGLRDEGIDAMVQEELLNAQLPQQ